MHIPHPDYLDDSLTGRQLLDWQRYARQFGLPNRRNDLHWGMVQALTYNLNRSEDSPAEAPAAFMPYHDSLDQDISKDEFDARLRSLIPRGIHTACQSSPH